MARVYVSSTYQDLKEHREAVRNAVPEQPGPADLLDAFAAIGTTSRQVLLGGPGSGKSTLFHANPPARRTPHGDGVFGFVHRTFTEYFAARHVLDEFNGRRVVERFGGELEFLHGLIEDQHLVSTLRVAGQAGDWALLRGFLALSRRHPVLSDNGVRALAEAEEALRVIRQNRSREHQLGR